MAEENNNSVELDTDGVQEQSIEVDAPKDVDPAFQKKEDVDLGYTDVSNGAEKEKPTDTSYENERETKLDQKEETKDSEQKPEDLKEYSDKVQKRIDKLTFQIREAERREKAAVEYAKGLKDKYETIEKKFDETDTNYLKEYGSRIEAEREKVKNSLKAALESNDVDKITEAQDKLSSLAVEKEKVALAQAEKDLKKKEAEAKPETSPTQPPQISQKAQAWAEKNEWFGSDRVLTSAAMGIHEDLIAQGIDAETDEYYNQINKRMKEYFPQKFAQESTEEEVKPAKEPVQNVGSVSRRSGGRKAVKLTKSQVVIAKKLGVPLEEYAKYVKGGN